MRKAAYKQSQRKYYRKNKVQCDERVKTYNKHNPARKLLKSAKDRARRQGLPFDITIEDIVIPECCPVFGTAFKTGSLYTASIDRVIPSLGYVKGNVQVISMRANRIKCDASLEELKQLVNYLESRIQTNV